MHIHEGVWAERIQHKIGAKVNRVRVLFDWSQEGQHHHECWMGALIPAELKDIILLYISLEEELKLLYHCTISWLPFLYFCFPFVPLRSLITETCFKGKHCSQAWIMKWLRPKWLLCVHSSAIYNRQDMEITCPSTYEWIEMWGVCVCVCVCWNTN